MKKIGFLIIAVLIAGAILYSCKKNPTSPAEQSINTLIHGTTSTGAEYINHTANGLTVAFSTTIYVSSTGYYYNWDFGDGQKTNAIKPNQNISHTYTAAGTYTVTLKVYNSSNSILNTYSKTIAVSSSSQSQYLSSTIQSTANLTSTSISAVKNASYIYITANTNYGTIYIYLPYYASQGSTYTCDTTTYKPTSFELYNTYGDYYGYHSCNSSLVSINVTSISSTGISGMFSGRIARFDCYGYTLSDGKFSVNF